MVRVLIKGTTESCLTCPQERTELKVSCLEENLTRAGPHWLLISNFQPPELGEINSHCWQATQSVTLWYTSLDWQRQLSIQPHGEGQLTSSLLKIGRDQWWSWEQADVMGSEGGPGGVLMREHPPSALFSLQIRTGMGGRATWVNNMGQSHLPKLDFLPTLNCCLREIRNLLPSLRHCILESFCYKSLVCALSNTIIWQL